MQLLKPLNEKEIDNLDHRLRRLDGVDISALDGILTAVACYPMSLSPDKWMPLIFPKNKKEALQDQSILRDTVRHLNGIESILNRDPEVFNPLFYERDLADEVEIIVDSWCRGFVSAMAIEPDIWRQYANMLEEYLKPILIFSSPSSSDSRNKLARADLRRFKQQIPSNIREIYRFLLAHRPKPEQNARSHHFAVNNLKTGRNDLCPCGSGKKYKLCCGLH